MSNELSPIDNIQNLIFTFRGNQVMIDKDLAKLYGVETKVLNQAVKRNISRFPSLFRFQLDNNENEELVANCDRFKNSLRSQSVTLKNNRGKHSKYLPYVFTEQV